MKNRVKAIIAVLKGKAIVLNDVAGSTEVYLDKSKLSSADAKRLSNDLFKLAYNLN